MPSLPSYSEATRRPHWVSVVAPYVSVRDYARLCLVDSQFYRQFAPRLWRDPLQAFGCFVRDPSNDFEWLHHFVLKHVESVRLSTRSLVLCLDFAVLRLHLGRHGYWDLDFASKGSNEIMAALPSAFPKLRCILLDGVPSLDVTYTIRVKKHEPLAAHQVERLRMISVRNGQAMFLAAFLASSFVKDLVYLDLSCISGSLKHELERSALHPLHLPCLRVLKAQGREMDNHTAVLLIDVFGTQLWSLDLSDNRLTDMFVKAMIAHNAGTTLDLTSLKTGAQYDVEGKHSLQPGGNDCYGRFLIIQESDYSATFDHPRRHLTDPPIYAREAHASAQTGPALRHNGRKVIRPDSCEGVKRILVGKIGLLPPAMEDTEGHEIFMAHGGITHLRLNGNDFLARNVERLLRDSPGHLEVFECDSTRIDMPKNCLPPWLSKTATFSGFIGASHLFRPAISANLQVLRIHHSLVTGTPSIKADNIPAEQCLWLAETFFERRVSMAYPQAFVPDMNPRLYSLTLTDIPRYSTGPVIEKITMFLERASIQERAIQDARAGSSHRRPTTVRGLRHLRLEFGEDVREARPDVLDFQDMDADALVSRDKAEFSFFGESGWASTSSSPTAAVRQGRPPPTAGAASSDDIVPQLHVGTEMPPAYSVRLDQFPFDTTADEHLPHAGVWEGEAFTVPVWIGSGIPGPHGAVNEYMRALKDPSLHTDVGPASPCHILAGVPASSYLFYAAWNAILAPPSARVPTAGELAGMSDVLSAIKAYRASTKAAMAAAQKASGTVDVALGEPHFHWTGTLEVSCPANT